MDNWESLLAIAGLAGEDWINKVYQAAQALSPNETDITSVGVELLQDIQKIFIEKNITQISTKELIKFFANLIIIEILDIIVRESGIS